MNVPKISVIVPVYKVEKYLATCIESILHQSFGSWELLLIDDGSPDNSGKICDDYACIDDRIKVIHKENAGVSAARNLGLSIAKGDYITFVDSDDWLEYDCFELCIREIEQFDLDLLQFSYQRINDCLEILFKNQTETDVLFRKDYINQDRLIVCAGGNFLKRSIIIDNELRFDEKLKLGEDQLFIYSYISNCNLCKRLSNVFYNYRYNNESASVISNPEECIKSILAFQSFPLRSLFKTQIENSICSFLFIIAKCSSISILQIYNLISSETFNYFIPKRKKEKLFINLYRINKLIGISLLKLL